MTEESTPIARSGSRGVGLSAGRVLEITSYALYGEVTLSRARQIATANNLRQGGTMDSPAPAGSQQSRGSELPPPTGADARPSSGTPEQDTNTDPRSGLVRRQAPEQIVVGEIRQNLDDLKSAILSYYSRLYSQPGRTIEERLDALAAPPFSSTVKMGRLPSVDPALSRSRKQPFIGFPPPNTSVDFLEKEGGRSCT